MTGEFPVLDHCALERARAMMGSKFAAFIQFYIKYARTNITTLAQTADSVLPASEAILPAHSLKSSSAQVGAARVAHACDIIEQQARARAPQEIAGSALVEAVRHLEECYRQVEPHLLHAIEERAE